MSIVKHASFRALTDWLTDYMEESSSWEADCSSASKEIHRNVWNPNVHYRVYNSLPPVPILSQSNPVRVPTPSLRSILVLSSHLLLGLPSGLLPSVFPHQNHVYTSPLHDSCYMPRLSHSSRFCRPKNIWWAVQTICSIIYPPVISSLVGPNIFLSTLFSNTLSLHFSLSIGERESFTPIQNYRDQPRGLVVKVSDYWPWSPGFDSRFYHGDFSW